MTKYLTVSSVLIVISTVFFTIYNKGIFIDGVDRLASNVLVLHMELAFLNYLIASFINWLITRKDLS